MTTTTPTFRLRLGGKMTHVTARLFAVRGEDEAPVRSVGSDDAAEREAIAILTAHGLVADDAGQGFTARSCTAIRFWFEGMLALPETWDLFVPEELVSGPFESPPAEQCTRLTPEEIALARELSERMGIETTDLDALLVADDGADASTRPRRRRPSLTPRR